MSFPLTYLPLRNLNRLTTFISKLCTKYVSLKIHVRINYTLKITLLVMKSKVLLLAFAATALTLTSKAQDDKTTFGVRAGVNFADHKW
jgi:hypothetical protein